MFSYDKVQKRIHEKNNLSIFYEISYDIRHFQTIAFSCQKIYKNLAYSQRKNQDCQIIGKSL